MRRPDKPAPVAGGIWVGSHWPATILLTLSAAAVILLTGNPLEQLEREGFDRALRARARLGWTPPSDRRIAILGIDDADMAALPDLAAEYQAVAAAISQASDLGAAVIVLDVIYARGTPEMARPILAAVENGAPVVFAEAWLTIPDARAAARRLRSFPFRSEPVEPAGLINIDVDADGVHRSYALLRQGARDWEPSLALAAYFVSRGIDWKNEIHQPRPGVIQWVENSAGRSAPTENGLVEDSRAARLLNFRGSWSAGAGFYHLNLRMLRELHGASAAMGSQPLAGKIIFLTNTTTGVADLGTTSFGPNQPQVLLHATALNDLLEDAPMRRTGRSSDALALLAVPVLVGVCGGRRHKRWLLLLWAMGCASIVSIGLALIFRFGWVPATVTTATLWTVAMVVELGRRHTLELAGRQRLRSTMGLYFSPRVLRDVLENPGRLEPKRVEITVLLTDLRNSTPLAELFGADHMLELLNRVFAVQTRAVFGEEGSLERPVGDQFLAYWGAPEPQPDAADRAMRAAFALVRGMRQLKETLELQVRELFGYGVALHAGSSLIGNIGSDQFFHYGLVGDLINAAARVESLTKYYGVLLIVTREFHDKLNAPPPVRTLDRVIVKGRTTVLDLLEVRHPFSPENFAEVAKRYGEAFALYQRGSFAEAACLFSALAPDDPPSRVLAARCTMFAGQAPGEWAGIFKMETK